MSPDSSGSQSVSPPATPKSRIRRYPSNLSRVDPKHVPLHRRGTSNTYERLEDLLREAGYKETRIFTPEHDKFPDGDKKGKSEDEGSKKGGVAAGVVGFLAGLIPGATKQGATEDDVDPFKHSPESPPASKFTGSRTTTFTLSPASSSTNLVYSDPNSPSPSPRLIHNKPLHSLRSNHRSVRPQTSFSGPAPLAARNLLRHMQSVPEMPNARGKSFPVFILNEPEMKDGTPPLPSTWLDSVKNAVNSSSAIGAHAGGPREQALRSTKTQRKKENHPVLHEHTNLHRGRPNTSDGPSRWAPHQSLAWRVASPGLVTTVNVMCRSAPGSRSSSLVRGSSQRNKLDLGRLEQELRGKGKGRGRARKRTGVPSLVATRVDDWDSDDMPRRFDHADEDEDEEGELDLARLLVHPKRQQSIQSLRQNLQNHSSSLRVGKSGVAGIDPWKPEDDSEDGASLLRGRRRRSPDEVEATLPGLGAKRRNGIPSDWAA